MNSSVRIIPVLLLENKGLVKTVRFKNPVYIGDPINAVRILNDKEVDELVFLDIGAGKDKMRMDFEAIRNITEECFMPLGIGGGIRSVEDAKRLFKMGIEKIILNTLAISQPYLIRNLSDIYGSQSIVVCLDVKKNLFGKNKLFIKGGTQKVDLDIFKHVENIQKFGAGEIIINSIDNDGIMKGYDLILIEEISRKTDLPVVACGGAGVFDDFHKAVNNGASAVAAGSMFVYQGPHRAVLINYPKEKLSKVYG